LAVSCDGTELPAVVLCAVNGIIMGMCGPVVVCSPAGRWPSKGRMAMEKQPHIALLLIAHSVICSAMRMP
jgi:hypothetical protein